MKNEIFHKKRNCPFVELNHGPPAKLTFSSRLTFRFSGRSATELSGLSGTLPPNFSKI
jgi:hypothetical protein